MRSSKSAGKKAAQEVDATVDPPRVPWTARLWTSVGLPWIVVGITTYAALTVLGRMFLHSQDGLTVLRREVPSVVYDRSTSIFLTALAIDLLNIVFERQTIKLDCVLLPAFIKGMASTTNVMVRFFQPVVALTAAGRPVVVQRYICWMHTTPSILMLLKMISSTITPREAMTAILFDEIMVITGVAGLVTTGWQRVLWSIVTHVAMLPVVPYMHKAFTEAMEQVRTRPLQLTMLLIYVLNLILWCTFAVTWDLALLGWISVATEEVLYVGCDFSAKVLFSSTLMLSSFKEFEARRENAMRVIESSSKAKLIAELQALLEQKERFMSSVSHELRTPLNGIIGISEGMLSGCCGVLPEGVRRQIYIIRTSGARLLALINDVMDAAALRQNKLVLKQEQVLLRHVVDDVLDLTRSLVDSEVALANLVPPRMLVVGDTGRIVQILNNLLGNAAKFTRRGQIRVTARQVEGGRRVAVTVADTGIGIPRNKLATIFLPFEQVDMSISRKYGGFGLGLNIVQELVKAHGGTINVSSIEGKGSAFTFTLPLARAMGRESLEEAKAAAQRSSAVEGSRQGIPGASGGGGGGGGVGSGSGSGSGGPAGGGGGATSATLSVGTPRTGGGGDVGDDSSTIVSSSDASRRPGAGALAASGAAESELEQYGELMYNAAELSALASSRPYTQSVRDSVPPSLEGGSSAANSPVVRATGRSTATRSRGEGGTLHRRRQSKSGGAGAAAAGGTTTVSAAGGASADESPTTGAGAAKELAAGGDLAVTGSSHLPGGDAKLVHGPRPFHYTMYKRFLLLSVDDDPVNQSVIKSLLGSTEGYEVVAVPSGPEALRYVATASALPDLVLLDCMMPEMDGYEVLQRLRAMTPNVHLPIIMVSAQTEEEHVVCGLDLGADDYVTKPFKRNELLARIRAQLAYGEWDHDDAAGNGSSTLLAGGLSGGVLDSGNNLAEVAAAAAAAAGASSGGGGGRRTSNPGASGGDQRLIVCIDDDDVNQVVLQGMLMSQHYRYVRASTGAQGLSYVCGAQSGGIPPDLVLLDCSLPDMTGFDVCRCIRQMYNKQQVPIIMLSARHNESAVVEGLKCGANTYVTKPFRRNELLARIRLHLRSREGPSTPPQASQPDSSTEESEPRITAPTTSTTASMLVDSDSMAVAADAAKVAARAAVAAAGASATGATGATALSPTWSVSDAGGVRIWSDAAILVVAVADYAGLCRMLLPSEMAELTALMLSAFDRIVAAHGVVKIESGSGVMSAAVLPTTLPPLVPEGGGSEAAAAAAAAAAATAAGLRLAALHRVGRALLEAAATIPVPGTATCVQLQQAMALGTLMGHCTAAVANGIGTTLYFGPVLAELLDLARRAPPMTIVAPDAVAHALRASGAAADIRGPLFLEVDDGGDGGSAAGAGAGSTANLAARRLWLVEAHPYAFQYLPPQLLYATHALPFRGSFLQRSGPDDASGSSSAAAAAAVALVAAAGAQQPPSSQAASAPLSPAHPQHPLATQQQMAAVPPMPHLQPPFGHRTHPHSSAGGASASAVAGGGGGAAAASALVGSGLGASLPTGSSLHSNGLVPPQQHQQHYHQHQQLRATSSAAALAALAGGGGSVSGMGLGAGSLFSSQALPHIQPQSQQPFSMHTSPHTSPQQGYPGSPSEVGMGALPSPQLLGLGLGLGHLSHLGLGLGGGGGGSAAGGPGGGAPSGGGGAGGGSVSNSLPFNASLGLYGNGLGVSRAGSRAFSHGLGLDSDAQIRVLGANVTTQHTNTSSVANTTAGSGNGGTGHCSGANTTAGGAPGPSVGAFAGGAPPSGAAAHPSRRPSTAGATALDSSGGGACITFSLQAAAAAVAAATAAAGGATSTASPLLSQPEGTYLTGPGLSSVLPSPTQPGSSVHGGVASGLGGSGGGSLLYGGSAHYRSSLNQMGPLSTGGGSGGGGVGVPAGVFVSQASAQLLSSPSDPQDSALTAAEPQIRALRNELAVMRQQLEALQTSSGRDSVTLTAASHFSQPSQAGARFGSFTPMQPAAAAAAVTASPPQPSAVASPRGMQMAGLPPAAEAAVPNVPQQQQMSPPQPQQQHYQHEATESNSAALEPGDVGSEAESLGRRVERLAVAAGPPRGVTGGGGSGHVELPPPPQQQHLPPPSSVASTSAFSGEGGGGAGAGGAKPTEKVAKKGSKLSKLFGRAGKSSGGGSAGK